MVVIVVALVACMARGVVGEVPSGPSVRVATEFCEWYGQCVCVHAAGSQ